VSESYNGTQLKQVFACSQPGYADIQRLAEEAVDMITEETEMADEGHPLTSSTPKEQTYEYYMQNLDKLIYPGARLTVIQVG
jgi:hypothetical protein